MAKGRRADAKGTVLVSVALTFHNTGLMPLTPPFATPGAAISAVAALRSESAPGWILFIPFRGSPRHFLHDLRAHVREISPSHFFSLSSSSFFFSFFFSPFATDRNLLHFRIRRIIRRNVGTTKRRCENRNGGKTQRATKQNRKR